MVDVVYETVGSLEDEDTDAVGLFEADDVDAALEAELDVEMALELDFEPMLVLENFGHVVPVQLVVSVSN